MSKTQLIKKAVKETYASLATNAEQSCCGPAQTSKISKLVKYGYSSGELEGLPESVTAMADGCGNPTALATIKTGDIVLDLGSGGGIDVFLASKKVGRTGRVVGLDMTPEMIKRATTNARRMNLTNVEFKQGEIERIPLTDESVDVIMSNCVICLSPDKDRVFRDMLRVLRPGGRLAIADELALRPFSAEEKSDPDKWCKCITGAVTEREYTSMLMQVGFEEVYVKGLRRMAEGNAEVFSAFISAAKPLGNR